MSTPSQPEPAPSPSPVTATPEGEPRRAVFVVGSGRSGTSTMSGTLQTLGVHVPQPEVSADDTNPKGFGEPQWVVDFHDRLLQRCNVQVSDARPQAWFEAGKLATDEAVREELFAWLEGEFTQGGDELVIKDPRLSWFVGLWRSAALRCVASPTYITMLRPVTEVVGSKQRYYASKFGEVNRTAAWINMMLHTERATRGSQRAFVRYHDLLKDWTVPLFEIGEQFDLHAVKSATANDIRLVHNFIDPSLRRVHLTWDDLEVPKQLQEFAEETWHNLDKLAEPGGDSVSVHANLDALRSAYSVYYAEAEALTQSTAVASRREGARERPVAQASTADKLAAKVPHGVRAKIPPKARQAARRALGR